MTGQKVRQLWGRQNRRWLSWVMLGLLLIGIVTAVQTTQLHQATITPTQKVRLRQLNDYHQHPNTFKVNGKPVSLAVYNLHERQFFKHNQSKLANDSKAKDLGAWYEDNQTLEQDPSVWYAGLMLLAGLIMAFFGRRTHYYEFLIGLGATRRQIWRAQLQQGLLLLGTTAIAQLCHWGWIIAVIPAKYQQYRVTSQLFGHSMAIIAISGCLFGLGWLVGQVIPRFWLAGILSLLVWRSVNGMMSNSGYSSLLTGNPNIMPGPWLYLHYGVASGLALVVIVVLASVNYRLFHKWSVNGTVSWLKVLTSALLITLGVGTLFGDLILQPFMSLNGANYEIMGMLVTLIMLILIGWYRYYRQGKGVPHAA